MYDLTAGEPSVFAREAGETLRARAALDGAAAQAMKAGSHAPRPGRGSSTT